MRKLLFILFGVLSLEFALCQDKNNSRPQTPVPPFPYKTDSLVYRSLADSLVYGVTLTIPDGKGPFPAIILITGSGAQDRNEAILRHQPFAVIADYLTRQGYLVMRVDDRGIGLSNGNFAAATTYDFASDVEQHIAFLQKRKDVNKQKIGLLGHSEGGMIAPLVAVKHRDISFVILLAGPGIPVGKLMAEQNYAVLKASGIDSLAALSYSRFFEKAIPKVAAASDTGTAKAGLVADLKAWQANENPNRVIATTGIHDEKSLDNYVKLVVKRIYTPWFRAFLLFDPQPNLRKLQCKVLALNGSRDIQVLPASNLQGIRESLAAGGNKHYVVEEVPGLNHLFQTCKACTLMEYGVITETVSPLALELMRNWLQKEINGK